MDYKTQKNTAQRRLARASRSDHGDDLAAAARDFAFAKIAETVTDLKARYQPSLTPAQKRELRALIGDL